MVTDDPTTCMTKMGSRKKEKTASKLDHQHEVHYPLDYSFKTLGMFEGIARAK